jgi:hypothetical protein
MGTTLGEQVSRQRLKYMINSYQLGLTSGGDRGSGRSEAGAEGQAFDRYLGHLLRLYSAPLLELAVAQTLVRSWLMTPLPRGIVFLEAVDRQLAHWIDHGIDCRLSPQDFQQVTGLDPYPVYQALDLPFPSMVRYR